MCMSMAPRKTNKKEIKPAKQLKSANFPIPQTDEAKVIHTTHYSLLKRSYQTRCRLQNGTWYFTRENITDIQKE